MRIEKDRKKAYIGVGFQERSEALDFKIALQEYKKYLDEPEYEEDSEEQDYSSPGGRDAARRCGHQEQEGDRSAAE